MNPWELDLKAGVLDRLYGSMVNLADNYTEIKTENVLRRPTDA